MTKYFTNFEDSSIADNPPVGFTRRWLASTAPTNHVTTVEYGSPIFKRRQLRYEQAVASYPGMLSIDAVDADAERQDVEALIVVKRNQADPITEAKIYARGSGAIGAENSYFVGLGWADAGNADLLYIGKLIAGGEAFLDTLAYVPDTSKAYYLLLRVEGTAVSGKVWAEDEAEPADWMVTGTDSDVTGDGWVGFQCYGAGIGEVNYLTVGTDGDSAPRPVSNADYYAWLDRQDVQRVVLAEMSATGYDSGGSPYTKTVNAYLANFGYTSKPWDSPANQHYQAVITSLPTFRREMDIALRGEVSVSFGSIMVSNPRPAGVTTNAAGIRDDWLRMKWDRDYVRQYLGDPSWPKHDFRLILLGRLGQPLAPAVDEIEFPVSDLTGLLDQPLQTTLYTSGPYSGQCKPILAGYALWMEPVPTSTSTLEQQLHDGSVDAISTVYDDGVEIVGSGTVSAVNTGTETITASSAHGIVAGWTVVFLGGPAPAPPAPLAAGTTYHVIAAGLTTTDFRLSATVGGSAINLTGAGTGGQFLSKGWSEDLSNGKFTLAANPSGRIMVKGAARQPSGGDNNKPSKVIEYLIFDRYGLSADFKDADSFADLLTDVPNNIGCVFYGDKVRALDALHRICEGCNIWRGFTPDGLMQVGRLALPKASSVMDFTESDVAKGSLRLERKILPANRPMIRVEVERHFYLSGPLNLAPWKYYELLRQFAVITGGAWPAAGTPLDDHPDKAAYTDIPTLSSLFQSTAESPDEADRLETFYELMLGVFSFRTRLSATRLSIGQTISLTLPRMGWRTWSSGAPASPDNTADIDSTKAVVIGIDTDFSSDDPFKVTLTVFRQIPGYYPTANVN